MEELLLTESATMVLEGIETTLIKNLSFKLTFSKGMEMTASQLYLKKKNEIPIKFNEYNN